MVWLPLIAIISLFAPGRIEFLRRTRHFSVHREGNWKHDNSSSPLIWSQRHRMLHWDLLLILIHIDRDRFLIRPKYLIVVTMTSVSRVPSSAV